MILMDFSSIAMSSVMVNIDDIAKEHNGVRHVIFNMIRSYNKKFRSEYGELIICLDQKGSWRRDVFPHYKAKRKAKRKESNVDWNSVYRQLNEVVEEITSCMPYRVVGVEGCEADDVIGAICNNRIRPEPILILSPDLDFVQLHGASVRQYSNTQKKFVVSSKDHKIEIKVLRGDFGDGIPNVLSDDDVLIEENKRQTPLTQKKIELLLEDENALGEAVAKRIERNRELIDLTRTPLELKRQIFRELVKKPSGSMSSLMTLLSKHRMKEMFRSLADFEKAK